MYYVYLLFNPKRRHFYIGVTSSLKDRIQQHKKTKKDYVMVYYEAYLSKKDAFSREKKLKLYGSSLGHLKKRIKNTLTLLGE